MPANKKVNSHDDASTTIQRMLSGAEGTKTFLKTDQLNVVGENHKESDSRRTEEEEYAKRYSGSSNYWQEHQFRVLDRTYWEKFHSVISSLNFFLPKSLSYSDKRPFADTFKERFLQHVAIAEESNIYEILEDIVKIQQVAELEKQSLKKSLTEWHFRLTDSDKYISEVWILIEKLKSDQDGFELTEEEKKQFKDLDKYTSDIKKSWRTFVIDLLSLVEVKFPTDIIWDILLYKDLNFPWATTDAKNKKPASVKVFDAANSAIAFDVSVNNLVVALAQSSLYMSPDTTESEIDEMPPLSTEDLKYPWFSQVARMRSRSMHAAANSQCDEKGVWKIGEEHVRDIIWLNDKGKIDKIKYNLVNQADFNIHFEEWRRSKKNNLSGTP